MHFLQGKLSTQEDRGMKERIEGEEGNTFREKRFHRKTLFKLDK